MNDTERAAAKQVIHQALHELNVRIVDLKVGDCHCNLVAEVVLDALAASTKPTASPEGWDDAWSRQQRAEADDPANWAHGAPVHAEELDEHGRGTGHARCDTGDGTFVDGPIANSTWQVTCEKCLTGDAESAAESGSAQ